MRRSAGIVLLLLAACSAGDGIEGVWKCVEEDNVITFSPGGAFQQVSFGNTYTGVWRQLDLERVEVRFTGEAVRLGTLILQIRFKDGGLRTINPAGRTQFWKRP